MRRLNVYILSLFVLTNIFSPSARTFAVAQEKLTVILILDNSGSMKNNDPENLRFSGAQVIAGLLDPGDEFGLILFSTQSRILTDGLETIGSVSLTEMPIVEGLTSSKADGFTDVNAALQTAAGLISASTGRNKKVVIVLLTDGKPEIQNPYAAYERDTLEFAGELGVPVMAIALTQSSQTPFLSELVQVTDGKLVYAEDSSDLIDAFLQVLGEIKDRTVIEAKKRSSSQTLEVDQSLAPYIDSATFIIAKPETLSIQVLAPDGIEVDAGKLTLPASTLITLENPAGGMYTFYPQGKGEIHIWAILRSRLRARVISPHNVYPSGRTMPIVVNLLEETTPGKFTKIIGEADFTAMITMPNGSQISLDQFYDDGTHGDETAEDGNYTRIFPDTYQTGGYKINIQGRKGQVSVDANSLVQVVPFPEIVVDAPITDVEVMGEAVELKAHLQGGDVLNVPQISATVITPSGKVQELVMDDLGDFHTARFMPMEEGRYQVTFATQNAVYLGVAYRAEIQQSFNVTLIPFVHVAVDMVDMPSSCFSRPRDVIATLSVNASQDSILHLSASGEWELNPDEFRVRKGEQEIRVSLHTPKELNVGNLKINLFIAGEDKVLLQPAHKLILSVDVLSLGERCRIPIQFGGVIFLLVVVGVTGATTFRKSMLPLPVSGTLRHWESGKNNSLMEIDLTAFNKNALVIGSGATCDVVITAAGLESEHAMVKAKKTVDRVEIFLEPAGEVQRGYSRQIAPFDLRHGETFRMGTREFQYLSDNGE